VIYCPKYQTWIHYPEDCDYGGECWQLEDWDSCVILKRKVKKVERRVERVV